jgi:hypothetical protein
MVMTPKSTKDSLELRLLGLVRADWRLLRTVTLKFKAPFAHITVITRTGPAAVPPAIHRLRQRIGLHLYRAGHGDYTEAYFPDGTTSGTPEDAFTTASRPYLSQHPETNYR